MKKKTLLLIAALAVILIIFSARTDFSAYSSSYRVNASLIEYNEDDNTNKDFKLNLSSPDSRVKVSVFVLQNDLPMQVDGCRDLQIKIRKDTNIGLSRYIPLFKIPGFSSKIDFNWTGKMINGDRVVGLHNKGSITIKGSYRIIGACSAKTTTKLIKDRIMEQTRKMIEENIRKEMGKQVD